MLASRSLDVLSRTWWRTTGRPVDLEGPERWLRAPVSPGPLVRDGWLAAEAAAIGGTVHHDVPGAGLLADVADLDGPGFRAADLAAPVRVFYETSR